MLRIGKMTDYAFMILDALSERPDKSLSAQYIANLTKLPEPTVSKIMKTLSRGGVVSSPRGAAGGYKLIKPAPQLSLLEVVEVMEGKVRLVECVDPAHDCQVREKCNVKGQWSGVNELLRNTLAGWSLNDLKEGRV